MKAGRMINQMSAAILIPAFANQRAGLLIHVPLILSSQNFGTGLQVQILVKSAWMKLAVTNAINKWHARRTRASTAMRRYCRTIDDLMQNKLAL